MHALHHHASRRRNRPYHRQSTAALVLGCASAFFWFAFAVLPVLAILFGSTAMRAQRRLGYPISGMAVAGLVLGIVFTAVFAVAALGALTGGALSGGTR
jgi:lipopolysaccharide export LptBFGC system permease protein LptF